MPFQIIEIESGFVFSGQFETPTAALACIAEMQTHTGLRYRMARVVTDEWREREALRLRDGTYTPLPAWWTDAPWWRNSTAAADHYAHVSECGELIAYTQTPEKGEADTQTPIKATRYLTKYLSDRLTPQEIVIIGSRFAAPKAALSISYEAADFTRVYMAAAHCAESSSYPSCMRYEAATFGTPRHPVEAYAGHGLAIAFIQLDDGSIPARAIVWPEKKIFVRVYGIEESDKHNMATLLADAGYTREDGFDGAKLSRIPFFNEERLVIPYIDGDTQRLEDRGDYLIITRHGEIDGSSTAGWAELVDENSAECDRCGAREDLDECHTVSGGTWCSRCANRHAFYCQASDEMFCNSVGSRTVTTRRGQEQTWCEDACDDVFHCEATETDYDSNYYTAIEVNIIARYSATQITYTATWCEEETRDERFYCAHTEEFYCTADFTPIEVNGQTWCAQATAEERSEA